MVHSPWTILGGFEMVYVKEIRILVFVWRIAGQTKLSLKGRGDRLHRVPRRGC
jgi:hypothetical protein